MTYIIIAGILAILAGVIFYLIKKTMALSKDKAFLQQRVAELEKNLKVKDDQLKLAVNAPTPAAVDNSLQSGTF